ncbi:uncharacterized protein LOC109503869 [Harpegnathos saltator]|uniref:uncharacterized protein LOC109503869 n=1 Tax=Harpegnathos saltator TaxID=610380 RepID=UPI0009491274|nr:uncharacterized protein LOC109503869 [Harpegnathos saltator]
MICVKSLQLDLNRVLLLAVGLWPYEQSIFVRLQLILFYGILITSFVAQLATFLTSKCTLQFVMEILSAVSFFICFMIKYITFCFNTDIVKRFLEIMQHTYNELTDENEIAIIEKYGTIAKHCNYIITLLCMSAIFNFIFLPFWPRVLNVVWLANESHSLPLLQIKTEYFCNQEKYFYLILLHTNAVFCIGEVVLLATGAIIIAYLYHACGMFKVASYRMEQAVKINTMKINDMMNENSTYKMIVHAIDMHRNAIKSAKIFISDLNVCLFFLIAFGTISTSLNLYRIFHELTTECDFEKLITPILFLLTLYVYMIFSNYCGQIVIDHNEEMFATVYSIQWYSTPLRIQKIILFLLQKGTKTFYMNVGGLFVGSLKGLSTLVSTSVSYFMIMYSTMT